jgi:hypothetical protein
MLGDIRFEGYSSGLWRLFPAFSMTCGRNKQEKMALKLIGVGVEDSRIVENW